jgi:hypothetical protein
MGNLSAIIIEFVSVEFLPVGVDNFSGLLVPPAATRSLVIVIKLMTQVLSLDSRGLPGSLENQLPAER